MEPIKIFLDTNILLDYYTGRMGDSNAEKIVQIGKNPEIELCISVLTAINVLYITKRTASGPSPSDIAALFHILSQDYKQYCRAQTLGLADFEDNLQLACAIDNGCRAIISRDKHFKNSPLQIYTPVEFIEKVTL